jgi:hypothetical protein
MSADSSPPSAALLLVAAKSLQAYVLGSDKLREMVGATQLIEDFCSTETAEECLAAMGISDGTVLTGAAGQLTIRFDSEDSARRAAAFWPWFASRLAPGLEVHVGVAPLSLDYKGALDECQKQIALSRNRPPAALPPAAPPHRRNPRSGLVAVGFDQKDPDREINKDKPIPVDAIAWAKRQRRERMRGSKAEGDNSIFSTFGLVPARGIPGGSEDATDFIPESFEEITKGGNKEDRTYLAIVHADGNGFGKLLMDIGNATADWDFDASKTLFTKLSEAIKEIGGNAAKAAIAAIDNRIEPTKIRRQNKKVLVKPWLPIVQAGDDLTLVIRADLAFDFLVGYLQAFEEISALKLAEIRKENPGLSIPEKLTAGGAIVYCKTQHPFSQAYALCESLAASRAKGNRVKENGIARSALAFHRITASTCPTDIDDLSAGELRCTDTQKPDLELGCQTWFVADDSAPFCVTNLESLRDALAEYPSGTRRQILSDLRTNRTEAVARLARMVKIGDEGGRGDEERKIEGKRLKDALAALHGDPGKLWRDPAAPNEPARSAIPDALVLLEAVSSSSR